MRLAVKENNELYSFLTRFLGKRGCCVTFVPCVCFTGIIYMQIIDSGSLVEVRELHQARFINEKTLFSPLGSVLSLAFSRRFVSLHSRRKLFPRRRRNLCASHRARPGPFQVNKLKFTLAPFHAQISPSIFSNS